MAAGLKKTTMISRSSKSVRHITGIERQADAVDSWFCVPSRPIQTRDKKEKAEKKQQKMKKRSERRKHCALAVVGRS